MRKRMLLSKRANFWHGQSYYVSLLSQLNCRSLAADRAGESKLAHDTCTWPLELFPFLEWHLTGLRLYHVPLAVTGLGCSSFRHAHLSCNLKLFRNFFRFHFSGLISSFNFCFCSALLQRKIMLRILFSEFRKWERLLLVFINSNITYTNGVFMFRSYFFKKKYIELTKKLWKASAYE